MTALGLPARAGPHRPAAIGGLAALVLLAHLLLADGLVRQTQAGWGSGDKPPPAIEVAFVRELQAAAPAARTVAAVPAAARLPALAVSPKPAASQALLTEPTLAEQAPGQTADSTAPAPMPPEPALAVDSPPRPAPPEPPLPAQAAAQAVAQAAADILPSGTPASAPALAAAPDPAPQPASAASAAPAVAGAPSFDWPPSTRMNYRLSGHYRGPVNGSAQVEWLREGSRYQVRMRTAIGPVLSRQIVSEGELTDRGLAPRRFDGEQKVLFSAARRWGLRFTPERITLGDGREIDSLPGAQDEASQFVQLTWLFTTQPALLQVGKSIELPLIINRTLERWTYDVVAEELLQFPFGSVPTLHVKPRREARGSDLLAEIWFAPTLQYLPVRILIRQREDSYADLTLERPPLQAAAAR